MLFDRINLLFAMAHSEAETCSTLISRGRGVLGLVGRIYSNAHLGGAKTKPRQFFTLHIGRLTRKKKTPYTIREFDPIPPHKPTINDGEKKV